MLKRLSCMIIIAVLLCLLFTGCGDAIEVDDEVYVLAVGLDKGMGNKLRLTIQYPTYKRGGGQDSGSQQGGGGIGNPNMVEGANIQTMDVPTIMEGLDMFGMAISRRVTLTHAKLIIFSEELARKGIGDYLGPLNRFRETRSSMNTIITRGSAESFIKENRSSIGDSLSKSLELMSMQSNYTSFFPFVHFSDLYRGMLSTYEQAIVAYAGINDFKKLLPEENEHNPVLVVGQGFLPGDVPREGVEKREFAGTAVFDGDKMVGILDSYETRFLQMVTGKFQRGIITIEDKHSPNRAIAVDLRTARQPKIKAQFEGGIPVIHIKLSMECGIDAIQSRIGYERLKLVEDLNNQIKDFLLKGILKVIQKVQKEYKSDIFGFGHKVVDYFPTIQEWEKYNWLKHFEEARINVDIDVNVRRQGLMIGSSPIRSIENQPQSKGE